jgi:hypothetical protein
VFLFYTRLFAYLNFEWEIQEFKFFHESNTPFKPTGGKNFYDIHRQHLLGSFTTVTKEW